MGLKFWPGLRKMGEILNFRKWTAQKRKKGPNLCLRIIKIAKSNFLLNLAEINK